MVVLVDRPQLHNRLLLEDLVRDLEGELYGLVDDEEGVFGVEDHALV